MMREVRFSSTTAVNAFEDDIFNLLGIKLGGIVGVLLITLASFEGLLVLIRMLSDGVIANITLGLFTAGGSKILEGLGIGVCSQTETLKDLIVVTSISCMEKLFNVDSELNGIAGRTST
jgi:hypothetical protein